MIRITVELLAIDDVITFEGSTREAIDFLLETAFCAQVGCSLVDVLTAKEC